MRFGSLFAGIGGLDLGLERAGMTCAWQVEWNEWCRKVLSKHWPDVPRYNDITELTGEELEPVDLICGGFPCQPVSSAGKQLAQDDDRWLWPHFARLIRVLRPRYALMENVPGLLTANNGRAFDEVLSDLAVLGYDTEWERVSAEAVGAPHLRRRIFIIAYTDSDAVRTEQVVGAEREGATVFGDDGEEEFVAYPPSNGLERWEQSQTARSIRPTVGGGGSGEGTLADAEVSEWRTEKSQGMATTRRGTTESRECFSSGPTRDDWWVVEPDVGRVADGVSSRVDRLRGLGNAVVPQVAEYVGRCIMAT